MSNGGFFYFIYLLKEQVIPMVDVKELIFLVVLVSLLLAPFIIDYIKKAIERRKKK